MYLWLQKNLLVSVPTHITINERKKQAILHPVICACPCCKFRGH